MNGLAAMLLAVLVQSPVLAITGGSGSHKHTVKVVIPKDGDAACRSSDVYPHVEPSQCQPRTAPTPRPSSQPSAPSGR